MTGNQTTTASPEAAPPETPAIAAGEAPASRRRVLIVEDNETARKQIQVFLEADPGLAVDTAANGSDALKSLTDRLASLHLNYQVFSTAVSIRGAKWSTVTP